MAYFMPHKVPETLLNKVYHNIVAIWKWFIFLHNKKNGFFFLWLQILHIFPESNIKSSEI